MIPSDEVLARTYTSIGLSADRIATEPEAAKQFIAALPSEYQFEDAHAIAKRLIYLRKKGRLRARPLQVGSPLV